MGIGGPTQTSQLNGLQDVESERDFDSGVLAYFNQIHLQLVQLLPVVSLQKLTHFLQSTTEAGQLKINTTIIIRISGEDYDSTHLIQNTVRLGASCNV